MNGVNILVDPNFSRHIFFVVWRRNRIPMKIHELPHIDLILISHGHYDHLDRATIRQLPKETPVIVPFGLERVLRLMGKKNVVTLGKWKKRRVGDVTVTAVPAEHFMGRPPLFPITGYQGYVVEGDATVYFAGDTGMFDGLLDIGMKWDIDVALLPIGAYSPPSFRRHHMSPEDALEAGRMLRAKAIVPIHWGAFKLSLEPMREPLPRLRRAAIEANRSSEVMILQPGQSLSVRGDGEAKEIEMVPDASADVSR
jgi:L-ascorbate metabolism protein UlaG (beta-lactamase superfamily)